jgi:hypothetical protein
MEGAQVQGQSELHSETLCENKQNNLKKEKVEWEEGQCDFSGTPGFP